MKRPGSSRFIPFGLVRVGRRQRLAGDVVVYPAIYETAPPRAAGYDAMVGGKYKGGRRSNSGSQFSGVRPAQPGDPLKHIHWKSSSKGQGLMTKSFDEELSGRVAFIMDCGQSGDPKILDDCARAAGSLMFAALDEGHHVEWVELAGMNRLIVPPFSDGHEILDTLARIELTGDCLQPDRLAGGGGSRLPQKLDRPAADGDQRRRRRLCRRTRGAAAGASRSTCPRRAFRPPGSAASRSSPIPEKEIQSPA